MSMYQKLSQIAQILWDADENRLVPLVDYELDLQKSIDGEKFKPEDLCSRPLFKYLNENKLWELPTYSTFIKLMDNYTLDTKIDEVLTQRELDEESAFLDACLQTEVMQEAFKFLVNEGKISNDPIELKIFYLIFGFSTMGEQQIAHSSAFEHVFVGEKKQGKILGCHNWIQYYLLEKSGKTNYYGYFPHDCEYSDGELYVLGMQFYQQGGIKRLGGFMIGVSPEFELALYSILFLCSGQHTRLNFAGMSIVFNCYKMERDDDVVMATLFTSKN